MNQTFTTVKMPCRPLVHSYLENNFGKPVALIPENHVLMAHFCAQLKKKNYRTGKPLALAEYKGDIEIGLLEQHFENDGFFLSECNVRNFNNFVERYIKDLWRAKLDGMLYYQDEQQNYKKKFEDLLDRVKGITEVNAQTLGAIKIMKRELAEHTLNIKEAIDHVVYDFLKLDYDVLQYDTVKKDYYRHRNRRRQDN
jgi:hypothetical protein